MIDFEVEIFDELARLVLAQYPDAYVSSEYAPVPGAFPAVFILESSNVENVSTISSADTEQYADVTYTVQVAHPTKQQGKRVVKALMSDIDNRMRLCNLGRTMCMPVDNADDPSIYRMIARFTGVVKVNGMTYRR